MSTAKKLELTNETSNEELQAIVNAVDKVQAVIEFNLDGWTYLDLVDTALIKQRSNSLHTLSVTNIQA